jgi:hypothetical protein
VCVDTEVVDGVIAILCSASALITTSPTASIVAPCPTLTDATTLLSTFILLAVAISSMLPSPVIAPSVKVTLPSLSTCAYNF